jgi:heat shock protein HspQ
VSEFNVDRVVTHQLTPFANPLVAFDPVVNISYEAESQVVTDSNGNLITV